MRDGIANEKGGGKPGRFSYRSKEVRLNVRGGHSIMEQRGVLHGKKGILEGEKEKRKVV